MTDKELLKLAAKAAGIGIDWPDFLDYGHYTVYRIVGSREYWNPLTNDGDALRLAAKLWFNIKMFNPCDALEGDDVMSHGMVEVWREDDEDPLTVEYFKNVNLRYEATRRAIVCAAAEIGKGMK